MSLKRFVIDTNVLISAVVFQSENPRKALKRCLSLGNLVISNEVAQEYHFKLLSDKFSRFVGYDVRADLLQQILDSSEWLNPLDNVLASRDAKDNMFLALALTANASCILTGDKDLLVLHPFENIPIISPREFLDHYS